MSLRVKLLLLFTLAVAAAAGFTAWNAEHYAERQFQQADQQRSDAQLAQFRRELYEREAEVATSVQTIADAESTLRMVLDLSRPGSDPSVYAGDARGLAASHQLDFLELASADGTLISSAQWPEHVGYKNDWVTAESDWNRRGAFLDRVELPDRVELALLAVRMVRAGNINLYIIGGQRLNSAFLGTLSLPAGMRALLYRNLEADFVPAALSDAAGPASGAESFAPLIESLQKQPAGDSLGGTLQWTPDSGSERFVTLPLTGRRGELLGALLLGSAQDQRLALENYIGSSALVVVAAGLLLAFVLSWWIAGRVSRPLARLTEGIGEVASGDWDARVEPGAAPEVGRAIAAFNNMTRQLTDERAGQVARERAAAWRQLAGQLAAELKTLLPPLQKAVEGLARPAEPGHQALGSEHAASEREDEFADDAAPAADSGRSAERSAAADRLKPATSAMLQTLATLAACAGKLGEFAALPVPRLEAVNLNDAVRAAVQAFEPRFSAIGRPPITPELFLDDRVGLVRADAVLLRKALDNLLLFVMEDMPAGGTFTIHIRRQDDMAHMILSGSGSGLAPQRGEARAAAPDAAARVSGVGLSLATVQSIVSSHGGRISIESAPLAGTTFYLDWPAHGTAAPSSVPTFPAVLQNQPPVVPQNRPALPENLPAVPQNQKEPAVSRPADTGQPAAEPSESPTAGQATDGAPEGVAEPTSERAAHGASEGATEPATEQAAPHQVSLGAQAEAAPEPAAAPEHTESASEAPMPATIELALEPRPESGLAPQSQPQSQLESQAQSGPEPQPEPQPAPAEPAAVPVETLLPPAPQPAFAELSLEPEPGARLEALPEAEAKAPAETPLETPPQLDPQPKPEPEPQPEMQMETVGAPQAADRELAAVIEEVIETPRSMFRNLQHFASEADYIEEPRELENAALPMETSLGDAPGNLFGLAVPGAAPAASDAAPGAHTFTLAEAESHLGNKPVGAEPPVAGNHQPAPEPAPARNSQQSSSKAPQHHDGEHHDDAGRRLGSYSPLTYRW